MFDWLKEAFLPVDLNKEATDLYEYIVFRVSNYTPDEPGPGGTGPVQMVYAGYESTQSGWFALVFDRRPNAGHDGEWTSYLEQNLFERRHWLRGGTLSGEQFGLALGRMIVGVLQRASNQGVFAMLPKADGFRLGLEEFNGLLGWDSQTGYGGSTQ